MRTVIITGCLFALACRGSDATVVDESETATQSSVDPTAASTSSDPTDVTSEAGGDDSDTTDASTGSPLPLGPYVVMSFNVLCSLCSGVDFLPWDDRVPQMADTIARHDPDLLGMQEVTSHAEVAQLLDAAPGYTAIYFGADAENAYADALVFYRTDRFEAIEHGFYWLSPTPDMPYSTGFSGGLQLARLVAWVRLLDRPTARELIFATTHFDNNAPSQDLSAPLLLQRTVALGADAIPTIVVGDFNAQPYDPAYATLTEGIDGRGFALHDVFELAATWTITTNQDPEPAYAYEDRIDHLFVAGTTWTSAWWTVDMHAYGRPPAYVSDHFAIAASIESAR